jgi:hypothetical protein
MRLLALLRLVLELVRRQRAAAPAPEPEKKAGDIEVPVFYIGPTTADFRVEFRGEDVTELFDAQAVSLRVEGGRPEWVRVHVELVAEVVVAGVPHDEKGPLEVVPNGGRHVDPVTGHVEAPHLPPEPAIFERTEAGTPREIILSQPEASYLGQIPQDLAETLRRASRDGGNLELEVEVDDEESVRLTGARVTPLPRPAEDVLSSSATAPAPARPRYGYCPRCGAPGIQRLEDTQRPGQTFDRCTSGHLYPSEEAKPHTMVR